MGCSASRNATNSTNKLRLRREKLSLPNGRTPSAVDGSVGLQEVVALLNRTRLFMHLPVDEHVHVLLAKACVHEVYKPGEVIVRQDDVGDAFFAILSGKVSVIVDGKQVDRWRDGADFGEHCLLHDERRHATIKAESKVSTVKITRDKFKQLGLNRKLRFEGRRAVRVGLEYHHNRPPSAKTPRERALIAEALLANDNLQAMVVLDEKRVEKMVDVAWKEHVKRGTEVMVEGELADCFYIVQEGSFRIQASSNAGMGGQQEGEVDEVDTDGFHRGLSEDSVHMTPIKELSKSSEDSDHNWMEFNSCTATSMLSEMSAGSKRRQYENIIGVGGSFGELALLYNAPRFATARAEVDSVLWGIDRKHVKEILMAHEEEQLQRYIKYLNVVKSLDPLLEEEKHEIAEALVDMRFERGELIAQQGEPATTCHILYEGEVVIFENAGSDSETPCLGDSFSSRGSRRATRRLRASPGKPVTCCCWQAVGHTSQSSHGIHVIGEHALVTNSPCLATVQVRSASARSLALLRESFEMLIGPLEALAQTRSMRIKHNTSMRGAVNNLAIQNLVSAAPKREPFRARVTYMSDLKMVRRLGSGRFGNVELWQHCDGGFFAMKVMSKKHIVEMNAQDSIVNEKNIMLMTSSPFTVRLFEAYSRKNALYLLMEFAEGGEVHTVYNRWGFYGSEKHAQFYAAGVVLAFEHLHHLHIIHRDLKPENVLLDRQGWPKLADMGLAKLTISNAHTFCGTPVYTAPEVIRGTGYTCAIDWWGLGVFVFELLSGSSPFEAASPMKIFRKVLAGVEHMSFPPACHGQCGDFIRSLLRQTPGSRLPMHANGTQDLMDHHWYRGFDWESFRGRASRPPFKPKENDFISGFNADQEEAPAPQQTVEDGSDWDRGFATVEEEPARVATPVTTKRMPSFNSVASLRSRRSKD